MAVARGAEAATADAGGKWTLSVDQAPDGRKTITARLPADDKIPSGFDEVTPQLTIRYHAGQAETFVNFDAYLGSGKIPITVTFSGQDVAEDQVWRISTDGRAAAPPGEALAFVQRLKHSEKVTLRFARKHQPPVSTTFTTYGIDLVMKALISAGVKYTE